MAMVRFFTLRQCRECMCDLPHRRSSPGHFPGRNELSPKIGTIIRKHFPKDAHPATLAKAQPAGQHLRDDHRVVATYGTVLSESGRFYCENSAMAGF